MSSAAGPEPSARPRRRARRGWRPADLGDQHGVTAIVTGANSGLGLRTAVRLAEHGAVVVLACRDRVRGEKALSTLRAEVPEAAAELAELDLAELASVRRFASAWGVRPLDLLINNAGVMATPRRVTADGFELQLATNHLGHFALTGLLLPALLAGSTVEGPSRVVTLSSFLHRSGRMQGDDLMLERHYSPWRAYSQSKLANLLFMREFQRRIEASGASLASLAAHPGYAATNLQAVGPGMSGRAWLGRVMSGVSRLVAQSADHGAWPTLRAAGDPQARGGEYYGPRGLGEQRGRPVLVGMSDQAADPVAAGWLWDCSVELTGVDYVALNPAG